MIIICEKCQARYRLAENTDTPPIFKARCSKCSHVFTVHRTDTAIQPLVLDETSLLPEGHKIIAVCNQKGGVGKTSTAMNLGMSLALMKKRVLLVDFDMQASLSIIFGLNNQAKSFYDLMHTPEIKFSDVIKKTKYPNLWLLPSNPNLTLLNKKNINEKDFEHILRNKLEIIKDEIDHIIIDTPPSIELFTLNALMASDAVIIPTQCEFLSMHGVSHIEEAIKTVRKIKDKKINYRILVTMFSGENTAAKVIYKKIKDRYQDRVLDTIIEFDVKMQEAQIMNAPVVEYDKNSPSARQYLSLANEILGKTS
ncbi:MAG: AAA family ATPase [Thermodesulfobacteriota bacterium]